MPRPVRSTSTQTRVQALPAAGDHNPNGGMVFPVPPLHCVRFVPPLEKSFAKVSRMYPLDQGSRKAGQEVREVDFQSLHRLDHPTGLFYQGNKAFERGVSKDLRFGSSQSSLETIHEPGRGQVPGVRGVVGLVATRRPPIRSPGGFEYLRARDPSRLCRGPLSVGAGCPMGAEPVAPRAARSTDRVGHEGPLPARGSPHVAPLARRGGGGDPTPGRRPGLSADGPQAGPGAVGPRSFAGAPSDVVSYRPATDAGWGPWS